MQPIILQHMGFLKNKNIIPVVTIHVNFYTKCPEGKEQDTREALEAISNNLKFNELIILKKVCEKPSVKNLALQLAGSYV